MTFLQPFIFWGLPLVLLPIIIHLLNRLRHRPQPWAAMRFLISATRSSISNTRLRQLLVLLFRVLAVLMLLLFMARPLAGGWVGWALSPAPDAIVILLDRSASMESQIGGVSKREQAVKLLSQAAKQFEETSHLVIIDSALLSPQEIRKADSLANIDLTQPTDSAADLPAMLHAAFNWLIDNRAGTTELWIASDLQKSNWHPDDPRWKNVTAQIASLSQKVRVRLLALNQAPPANLSISVKEMLRVRRAAKSELQFVLDLQRNRNASATVPVTMSLDGEHSQTDLALEGQAVRWRHQVDLDNKTTGGWGSFSLPADANPRDNTAYFVYGPDLPLRAALVSPDPSVARILQMASVAPNSPIAEMIQPSDVPDATFTGDSLLIWQDTLPTGKAADRVRAFAEEGGAVIFFPPGRPDAQQFNGVSWGDLQAADADKGYKVLHWQEDQGPLAKGDDRSSLPLPQVEFLRRQLLQGQKEVLAAYEDGSPFLAWQTIGRGQVCYCSTLPRDDWSSLADGPVLVPMMQRLLLAGARRLQQVSSASCGELSAVELAKPWTPVDPTGGKDIRLQAGVYKSGDRLLAMNRPPSEDEPDILDTEEATKLFGDLSVRTLEDRHQDVGQGQGEVWRMFLFAMLAFLIGESILVMPARKAAALTAARPGAQKDRATK